MTALERLLSDYDNALSGDAWYADSVWTLISTISPEVAAWRPAPEAHTIWELLEHMMYWESVVRERMTAPVTFSEERNFPKMPEPTDGNWNALLERFRESNGRYRDALQQLDPARLDSITAGGKKTFYADAQGLIQHHIYHAGQIAMLKRLHAAGGGGL